MTDTERWVDVDEVSAHLGVGKDSIYRWIETKGFPAHRVGRLYRFKISEVDEWVRGGSNAKSGEVQQEEIKSVYRKTDE